MTGLMPAGRGGEGVLVVPVADGPEMADNTSFTPGLPGGIVERAAIATHSAAFFAWSASDLAPASSALKYLRAGA